MSNLENNISSEKNTEKSEVLFEALQNVPEELLARSEKGSNMDKVLIFIKQHKQICVACLACVCLGICFLGYQSFYGGDATANSTGAAQEMISADDAGAAEGAEDVNAELTNGKTGMTETNTVTDGIEAEENPQAALENDVVDEVIQEAVSGMETTKDLYAAYMPKELPEGYEIEAVNMSRGEQEEVLQVRLGQSNGQYIQLVIKRALVTDKQENTDNMNSEQQAGEEGTVATPQTNIIAASDLSKEAVKAACALVAESEDLNGFTVQYEDGVSVECEGTASAEDMYKVLAAYGNVAQSTDAATAQNVAEEEAMQTVENVQEAIQEATTAE